MARGSKTKYSSKQKRRGHQKYAANINLLLTLVTGFACFESFLDGEEIFP